MSADIKYGLVICGYGLSDISLFLECVAVDKKEKELVMSASYSLQVLGEGKVPFRFSLHGAAFGE